MTEVYSTNQISSSSHYTYGSSYHIGKYHITYIDRLEQGQGGASIGGLMVNDILIRDHYFSGPPLLSAENILVPEYIWPGVFKIARIHLPTLAVTTFGVKEYLILLKEVRDDMVYYENSDQTLNWIPGDDNCSKHVAIE